MCGHAPEIRPFHFVQEPFCTCWDRSEIEDNSSQMHIWSFVRTLFPSNTNAISKPASQQVVGSIQHAAKASVRKGIAETKPYAFLSYSRKDEGIVGQLAAYLAQEEIPPWVDDQLDFGERWEDVIMKRLQDCTVFLIAMSPHAKESAFVNRELTFAFAQRKLIIPILLSGEPFPELEAYQFVRILDTDKPAIRFVERLRELLTPGQMPSQQVQRRRVEHFLLGVFETILQVSPGARLTLGIGFDRYFGVKPEESLAGLDELEWAEVFICLRERLPNRDFHCPLGPDYGARFPTIRDFIDFVYGSLTWDEIRVL